jgi:hypothetical protein
MAALVGRAQLLGRAARSTVCSTTRADVFVGHYSVSYAAKAVRPRGFLVFGVALVLVKAFVFFDAPPASPQAAAVTALVAYAALAAAAGWLERRTIVQP